MFYFKVSRTLFLKHFFIFHFFVSSIFETKMTGPTDENERQLSAASSSTTIPPQDTDEYVYQMLDRLCPDETVIRRPRPGNFDYFEYFGYSLSILLLNKTHLDYSVTDPRGNPTQWVPYGRQWTRLDTQVPTGPPQLYARHCIPLNTGVYEVLWGVLPLPDAPSTSTALASESSLPSTPSEHAALLSSTEIPAHIQPFFVPKLLREGNTVKLYQLRFDERQNKFCYHVLAQPLRQPTATTINPQLRLSCPSVERKFDVEDILNFLRYRNIRPDGTYYAATPETIPDGRGYGPHGNIAPTTERKLLDLTFIFSLNNNILELKLAYKQGFRWQPVGYAVPATPLDTPPVSRWACPGPIYTGTSENAIPTGSGLDVEPVTSSLPWSTAVAPPLQPTIPPRRITAPYFDELPAERQPVPDVTVRRSQTRTSKSKTRTTTATATTTTTTTPTAASDARPGRSLTRSQASRQPSRPSLPAPAAPHAAPAAQAPAPPTLRLVPVTPIGVPGSSRTGLDMVSISIFCCTTTYFPISVDDICRST